MKIAVLADIHGNLPALEAVADDIARWRPDAVVVAGDIVNRGPRSLDCLRFVKARAADADWRVIRGNHEGYVLSVARDPAARPPGIEGAVRENVRWVWRQLGGAVDELAALPERVSLVGPDGGEVRVVHASMRHDRDNILVDTPDEVLRLQIAPAPTVFLGGHTHRPLVRRVDGTLVVNVGSAGLPFDGDVRACYARLEWRDGWEASLTRLPYDRERAARDFDESGYLTGGGPISELVYDELRSGWPRISTFFQRFDAAVMASELTPGEAVRAFLAELRV